MLHNHNPRSSLFNYQSPYEPCGSYIFRILYHSFQDKMWMENSYIIRFQTSIPRTCSKKKICKSAYRKYSRSQHSHGLLQGSSMANMTDGRDLPIQYMSQTSSHTSRPQKCFSSLTDEIKEDVWYQEAKISQGHNSHFQPQHPESVSVRTRARR